MVAPGKWTVAELNSELGLAHQISAAPARKSAGADIETRIAALIARNASLEGQARKLRDELALVRSSLGFQLLARTQRVQDLLFPTKSPHGRMLAAVQERIRLAFFWREGVLERRGRVAAHFLAGRGIEVGALHSPLATGPQAQVLYVDRMSSDELQDHYLELQGLSLAQVDVVDDGERLLTFPDESLDFVVANHMLEHCENPLGTIRSHLSKLKVGGHLFYAVPDKRHSFDIKRPMTPFEHLVRDDRDGPAWSRQDHFLEWATLVEHARNRADAEARAAVLIRENFSIHFHVWDATHFTALIEQAHDYLGRSFSTEWLEQNEDEIIAVFRKTEPGKGAPPSKRKPASAYPGLERRLGLRLRALAAGRI